MTEHDDRPAVDAGSTAVTGHPRPVPLGYAAVGTVPLQRWSLSEAVLHFVGGMAMAMATGLLLIRIGDVQMWALLVIPIVTLLHRPARAFGVGWLTAVALAFLTLLD